MGLFKKVFRDRGLLAAEDRRTPPSEFADSDTAPVRVSWRSLVRSRREAVHMVLRECMRQHAIPADWIESRLLVDTDDPRLRTFCILLLVRDGHASLQSYSATFQASFAEALQRFDPRSKEWLATICWSFDLSPGAPATPPQPQPVASGESPVDGAASPAAAAEPDGLELEEDLQALFAIRDAALRTPPRGDAGP